MIKFAFSRIISMIPVTIGVFLITSMMLHMVPGDPVDSILGDFATLEDKQELRERLGLNKSVFEQIQSSLANAVKGDLGESIMMQSPVTDLILERAVPTLELAIISMIVAILIAIPLGMLSAVFAGKPVDHVSMLVALLGVSIPNFLLGPVLILLFSLHFDLLPVSERAGWDSYILPSITLGTALAAVLSRMTRNSVIEALSEDYIRTARAKGVHPGVIVLKHAFRNASLPVITIVGLQFGVLLTGAIITEKIFDWPGLGTLMIEALQQRDYPIIQGCVLVFAMTYVLVNLVTDIMYGIMDPRISYAGKK
jgi:peptide/nickel transport system permease protein